MLTSPWQRFTTRKPKTIRNKPARKPRRFRLEIEQLESREMPATFTWTGAIDNDFNTNGNWDMAGSPGVGDDVVISISDTINVSADNSINTLTQSNGTLSVAATKTLTIGTVTGPPFSSWTAGTWSGSGQITFTGFSTLNIGGAATKTLDTVTVNNAGIVTWSGDGNINAGGATWNNSGTFDIQGGPTDDGDFNWGFGLRPTFINTGAVTKTSAFGLETDFGASFNNQGGSITVNSGQLSLGAGTNTGGDYDVLGGAVLDLTDGETANFTGVYTGSGAGEVRLASGSMNITLTDATFNFDPGLFQWTGGTLIGPVGAVLTNNGTITLAGGSAKTFDTLQLDNAGTINYGGTGTLNSGNGATLNNSGTFDIKADNIFQQGFGVTAVINNIGIFSKTGGAGSSTVTADLNNLAAGTVSASSGTLLIAGGGTGNGNFDSSTGQVEFSASYTLDTGATITGAGLTRLSNGTLTLNVPISAPNFEWTGGIISGVGSLTVTNTFNISGAANKSFDTTLTNAGTATWTGVGFIDGNGGAVFNNQVGAVFNAQNDETFYETSTFNNAGTFNKTSAVDGWTYMAGAFNNTGTVNVTSGTLYLNSGTSTGAFNVAAGADLIFTAGTSILDPGASFSGPGIVHVESGAMNANGSFSVQDLRLEGGTLGGTGTVTVTNTMSWTSGTMAGTGATTIQAGATLTISGATNKSLNDRTLNNAGTTTWSGDGYIDGNGGAVVNNSGSFTVQNDEIFWEPFTFNNSGTLTKTSAVAGFTDWRGGLNNTGTVNVSSGQLKLNGGSSGGTHTGAFNVAAFTDLDFSGGAYNLNAGVTFTGAGMVHISAGNVEVNADVTIPNLSLWGGTQGGAVGKVLSISNVFNWNGGTMNDFGATTVLAGATLAIDGTVGKTLDTRTLNNNGAATWTNVGNLNLQNGGVLNNTGTFAISTDADIVHAAGGSPTINNSGTFRKTGLAGTTTLGGAGLIFNNTGTVEAISGTLTITATVTQLSGSTLTGGTWKVSGTGTLDLPANITTNNANITLSDPGSNWPDIAGLTTNNGSIRIDGGRTFTTTTPVLNTGTITVGPASVFAVGGAGNDYTQNGPNGRTIFEIGGQPAGGQFGKLTVVDAATLNGFIEVQLVNGFGPTQGIGNYQVMTFASQSGSFTFVTPTTVTQGLGEQDVFQVSPQPTELLVLSVVDAADLETTSINGLGPATAGESISIGWVVRNNSSSATSVTEWVDSVYLSVDSVLDASDVLLGRVTHIGALGGGESYASPATLNTTMPGVPLGQYRVLVLADSRNFVPDTMRANNLLVSGTQMTVGYNLLTLGTPLVGQTINNDQDKFFRIDLPGGKAVRIKAQNFQNAGMLELYVRYQQPPDRQNFDDTVFPIGLTSGEILLPGTQAGPYYILVHGRENAPNLPSPGATFDLLAEQLPFTITSLENAHGSIQGSGQATVTIHGSGFTPATTATLTGPGTRAATQVFFKDSSTIWATFDLNDGGALPIGAYNVQVDDPVNGTDSEANAFTVNNLAAGALRLNVTAPAITRALAKTSVTVTYENTGETDIVAPFLHLTADWANMRLPEQEDFVGPTTQQASPINKSIQFIGINPDGPAGILPAGFKGSITLPAVSVSNGAHVGITYNLSYISDPAAVINWDASKAAMRPESISVEAWDAVFANFVTQVGTTAGSYQQALANDVTYLSQFGEYTYDVNRLIFMEYMKANADLSAGTLASSVDAAMPSPGSLSLSFVRTHNSTIAGRYAMGRLGRGWTDNWDISATTDADGNATIHYNGIGIFYRKNADGSYEGNHGNFTTLTFVDGPDVDTTPDHFELRFTDGTLTSFRSDGKLDFIEDSNGNRITAGFDGIGRLTSLTHTSGASLTIAYDLVHTSRIASVTDSAGRVSSYTYDVTGEHLLTYTDKYGTTNFTYGAGHALAEIGFSDNTHVFFAYDAQGRLIEQYRDPIALVKQERITFSYPTFGASYVLSDAAGAQTQTFFDDDGHVRRTIDPRGYVTQYSYDESENLSKQVLPDGTTYTYAYDERGNLTKTTDALGNVTTFTYSATNRLTSYTDARGNTTSYQYDAEQNLTRIDYADGAFEQYGYDAAGNVTSWTNARGQTLQYVYNGLGLVTSKTYADASVTTFTYDVDGFRLLTANDGNGNYTFTYNALDEIATFADPYGHSLAFTYNSVGQRLSSTSNDTVPFVVSYVYDAVGRLDQLNQGGNIVDYTYDLVGRLSREDKGNGTFTTYVYDLAGNLTNITHNKDLVTVNSTFDYQYDSLNRVTQMTTSGVQTDYTYDAIGQLTSLTMPGRSIQYEYDAVGNRTKVTDSLLGISIYAADERNRYISAGTTTFAYDADGNLLTRTAGLDVTNFTFNQENRLVGMSTPSLGDAWTFQVDPFGQRVATTYNAVLTRYVVDPTGMGNVVGEYDGANSLIAHYTHGLGLVSRVDAGNVAAYYDFELAGSTIGMTDAAGTYVNRYSYLPFGETTVNMGATNLFMYVGRFGVTSDGGLFHMRAREFDPNVGQFLSNDPLGLGGGDTTFRRYVGNNPIGFVDPSGLAPPRQKSFLNDERYFCKRKLEEAGQNLGKWWDGLTPNQRAGIILGGIGIGVGIVFFPAGVAGAIAGGALTGIGIGVGSGDPPNSTSGASGFGGGTGTDCGEQPPPPPPAPPGGPGGGAHSDNRTSNDPNEMVGPGLGARTEQVLPYKIMFENLSDIVNGEEQTLPAQQVTITQTLDTDLNLDTFKLTGFGWYTRKFDIPNGTDHYQARIDDIAVSGLYVDVKFTLNRTTRVATWVFVSLNPSSFDDEPDPDQGFLHPNTPKPVGEGFVTYEIKANTAAATGTEIKAKANIVFDTNPVIPTNEWVTVIDNAAPTGTTITTPTVSMTTMFTVTLAGIDTPTLGGTWRPIKEYDVSVSVNGALATFYQTITEATGTTPTTFNYTGVAGNTYTFEVVARDHSGFVQAVASTVSTTVTGSSVTLRKNGTNLQVLNGAAVVLTRALTVPGNISIQGGAANDTVTLDHLVGGPFTIPGTISFNGGTGTDKIVAKANANQTLSNTLLTITGAEGTSLAGVERAILIGGTGKNTLRASSFSGPAVLVGGGGNDKLYGGAGRNILIGGAGADLLSGGGGDDVLVGGATKYDTNVIALDALMKEWARATSYTSRTKRMMGTQGGGLNVPYYFKSTTLTGDGTAKDTLTGGGGQDWFLAKLGSDLVKDKKSNELWSPNTK